MSRPELRPDDSLSDPVDLLEQHLHAGFPPDLALDLVLNELVVRATEATHATAGALALTRGDELVCRAATGPLAPDLGVPLNTREGLSGACLETRQPQLSVDTEFDPRIDPVVSRRLGIRSILIVPVFDATDKLQFEGMLEVFSASPAAFSHNDQKILESFAEECARIRQAAIDLGQRKPSSLADHEVISENGGPDVLPSDFGSSDFTINRNPMASDSPYQIWTLVLGALAILMIIAVTFLIGSRIGWLSASPPSSAKPEPEISQAVAASPSPPPLKKASKKSVASKPASETDRSSGGDLVIYEKGKVIFRLNPNLQLQKQRKSGSDEADQDNNAIVEASSTTKMDPPNRDAAKPSKAKSPVSRNIWLSPHEAETRLLSRTEPNYPLEALSAHRVGQVVLEVLVAEDGSVSGTRLLSGDPMLATAAAEAVRNWRYEPYRPHDRPTHFQTDVTLNFTLPN